MPTDAVAHLKITLKYVKPPVVRTVAVPLSIKLDRLHDTIQAAMGWTNSHLYMFDAAGAFFGFPDADFGEPVADARKARLVDVLEDTGAKTLHYVYDFGDNWEHSVKISRIAAPEPGAVYPVLLNASGRCPPEDVGGAWGYTELLEALADPQHERREDYGWLVEGGFDPAVENVAALKGSVALLAKAWSRQPASRPRRKPAV